MSMKTPHAPVLLKEAISALQIKPDGIYLDATFGRGGHSTAILEQLGANGRLLAIDRDPQAVAFGQQQFASEQRFEIIHESFDQLELVAQQQSIAGKVDGILLDLGVSSPQLDNAERGFSFMRDGPLDMRMDTSKGQSAEDWINLAEADEIANVLYNYGEERLSRRIARKIVAARELGRINSTLQLAEIIKRSVPRKQKHGAKHPATKSFQAIRIQVNAEMDQVAEVLKASINVLSTGGRLAVISFHSLEDRMVKRFMRDNSRGKQIPREIPVQQQSMEGCLKLIGKATKPSAEEVGINPRARSSMLRVAEKRESTQAKAN